MEKKRLAILIVGFILVAISLASIACSNTLTTSSEEAESPLFNLMTAKAIGEEGEVGKIIYLGQGENMDQEMSDKYENAIMYYDQYPPNTSSCITDDAGGYTCFSQCTVLATNCWPCYTHNYQCTEGIICEYDNDNFQQYNEEEITALHMQ